MRPPAPRARACPAAAVPDQGILEQALGDAQRTGGGGAAATEGKRQGTATAVLERDEDDEKGKA